MKHTTLHALILGSFICATGIPAYAVDDQATQDDNTVVGACMIQKFKEHKPPISEDKMNKCSDVKSEETASCLGLAEDEYMGYVKFCVTQLINAKCVAGKMKVTLMQYANCGYESNPACYKGLGFTMDAVTKLSTDCQSEAEQKK